MTPPPVPSADYFTMASTILKPFSTGTVGIRSGNVWDEPLIDPRYLSDERDQKVRMTCGCACTAPLGTRSADSLHVTLHRSSSPACTSCVAFRRRRRSPTSSRASTFRPAACRAS